MKIKGRALPAVLAGNRSADGCSALRKGWGYSSPQTPFPSREVLALTVIGVQPVPCLEKD
jgi:hypothetical protein